jgi:hypothetical protein
MRECTSSRHLHRPRGRRGLDLVAGVVLSMYPIVIILAMWLPLVIFDPCRR